MEEFHETPPEGEREAEDGQREAFQALDEVTPAPEAGLERGENVEEAEGIEAIFVELVDQNVETPELTSTPHEDKEDTAYRVKVKFPWIPHGDDEGAESNWGYIVPLATDGTGTWYLPEVEDEVVADTQEPEPQTDDIQPAGTDDGGEGQGRD